MKLKPTNECILLYLTHHETLRPCVSDSDQVLWHSMWTTRFTAIIQLTSRHLQFLTGGLCWCKADCLHALADSNQHIRIREKTLQFSSTVLYTVLSPYLLSPYLWWYEKLHFKPVCSGLIITVNITRGIWKKVVPVATQPVVTMSHTYNLCEVSTYHSVISDEKSVTQFWLVTYCTHALKSSIHWSLCTIDQEKGGQSQNSTFTWSQRMMS